MMIARSLLAMSLLAGSALAAAIMRGQSKFGPFFSEFPLSKFGNATNSGATPADIEQMTLPLSNDVGNLTDFHICIQDHNPFRQNCAKAIDAWTSQAIRHNEIYLSKGTCKSAIWGCCQSVVCAPLYLERRLPVWDLQGRFWHLLQDRCGNSSDGGIWRPEGVRSLFMLNRPVSGSCEVNLLGEERRRR